MHEWGERPRPPLVGDERTILGGWLDFHRATLLWKCEAEFVGVEVPPLYASADNQDADFDEAAPAPSRGRENAWP